MEKFRQTIIDSEGNIIPLATINVYDTGTTNSVSIFSDDGVTSESNPFTTGTDAVVKFYAADGRYDVKITKTGFDDILVVDQQLFDRNSTTQNGGVDNLVDTIIGADSDNNGTGNILLKIGGSTRVELKNNADFDLKTGNLIISGASKGIDFSATTGSSDPNVLDDYEEGTWTPQGTDTQGTPNEFSSYIGTPSGTYIKIGNLVYVIFYMRVNGVVGMTTSDFLTIRNLPFVVRSGQPFAFGPVRLNITGTAFTTLTNLKFIAIPGTSTGTILYGDGLDTIPYNSVNATVSQIFNAAGTEISGTLSYMV